MLKLNQISPLEYETLAPWLAGRSCWQWRRMPSAPGCVGQRTAAILAQHGQAPEKLVLINLGKTFLPEGPCPSWSIRQASTPRASPGRYRRRVHE